MSRPKPEILRVRTVARTRLFNVEAVDLEFSNGVKVTFERLQGGPGGAVMVIPVNDRGELVLVREYMAGIHAYELGFPKGRIDGDESASAAAERELREEAGFGARNMTELRRVAISPAYANFSTVMVVARELYESALPGDEPEPLEVICWPLDEIAALMEHEEVNDTRTLLALCMIRAGMIEPRDPDPTPRS